MSSNQSVKNNNFYKKANELCHESLYREAAANYLNAILIDRNSAECHFGLGICYKNLKQYSKAIKHFEAASELKDDYYEAFFELGLCFQKEGIACGAIKNFIRAIQINPDSEEAILQLGVSHELCEEFDLALMIYKKLTENSPNYFKAYDAQASLLMKNGKYKEALSVLNKVIKLNPDYHKAYSDIGICFEKLGKTICAQRYYRKYLMTNPIRSDFVRGRLEKVRKNRLQKNHLSVI